MNLLETENVLKRFDGGGLFHRPGPLAVNHVTLQVKAGQTLGIVGESGSGKSTLLRMMLRLVRPGSGRILYKGRDLWTLRQADLFGLRREVQAIFQDLASSFNPRQRIWVILRAPLDVHDIGPRAERNDRYPGPA